MDEANERKDTKYQELVNWCKRHSRRKYCEPLVRICWVVVL